MLEKIFAKQLWVATIIGICVGIMCYTVSLVSDSSVKTYSSPSITGTKEINGKASDESQATAFSYGMREKLNGSSQFYVYSDSSYGIATDTYNKDIDFAYLGYPYATALFKKQNNIDDPEYNVYSTPMVFLMWSEVVTALSDLGVVAEQDDGSYIVDTGRYYNMMLNDVSWMTLGVDSRQYCSVHVIDNGSGDMPYFLRLSMARALYGENLDYNTDMKTLSQEVYNLYKKVIKEDTSAGYVAYEIASDMSKYPVYALMENQVISYITENPYLFKEHKSDIRVVYPDNLIWSKQSLVPLTSTGKAVGNKLQTSDIAKACWETSGLRSFYGEADFVSPDMLDIGIKKVVALDSVTPSLKKTQELIMYLNRLNEKSNGGETK